MKNVMIIDDDIEMLEYYKNNFHMDNCQLFLVKDLIEAHRLLDHQKMDLIICDYKLHEDTGLDFLRSMRRYIETTPFILLSGANLDLNITHALDTKTINQFIQKPLKGPELTEILSNYFIH